MNHAAGVTGGIEVRDPVEIERVRLAAQVTEVLHDDKSLVVVLVVNLRALCDLSQHLGSSSAAVNQAAIHVSRSLMADVCS